MRHRPYQLSGGQRQRTAIARALVTEPSLLLCDEPTGNLDSATTEDIMALFHQLHAEGNTIIIVTHEPEIATRCPRAIRILDGKIATSDQVASRRRQREARARSARDRGVLSRRPRNAVRRRLGRRR